MEYPCSPLDLEFANIVMTELESIIVKELVNKSLIKICMRYANDTLLLVKDKDVNRIHASLNSFNKIIKFAIDNLPDGNINFLDIKFEKNHADI